MLYYNQIFILLLLQLLIPIVFASIDNDCSCPKEKIFESNVKDGVIKSPGFPDKYYASLDCKWNIQPEENTFIIPVMTFFETEAEYDTLDVYHTRWNGSELIKVKQASLSGKARVDVDTENLYFTSSINGGFLFHFVSDSIDNDYTGFEIRFSRYHEDNRQFYPCPQPFYFATNSPQRLPSLHPDLKKNCIFSINSTQAIKLTINHMNTKVFGIKVFETESFPKRYEQHQGGQLAQIERYSSFNSYPIIVTSRTGSVSILISSYTFDDNIVVPYEIEFVAVKKPCDCFPNNLTLCRIHPLNLLSPNFPEYCDNLNCSAQISLENPLNTNDYVESLQIQFNSFQTEIEKDLLHLKIPDEKNEIISFGGDAHKIKFFTFDSPKFNLNFTTNEVGLDTGFNLTIKYIKRNRECLKKKN
uniref:CUB domain-containing protein n=1 Tax=Meloidogyne enterolobii TaxID=390850 RepID=A0A6V7VR59_MELEN|nr:unnamed protein product [Meloidogyne enterolobii]